MSKGTSPPVYELPSLSVICSIDEDGQHAYIVSSYLQNSG